MRGELIERTLRQEAGRARARQAVLWQHARVQLEERLEVAERVVREGASLSSTLRCLSSLSEVAGPNQQPVCNSTVRGPRTSLLLAACTGRVRERAQ
jgi:hypothetical protein